MEFDVWWYECTNDKTDCCIAHDEVNACDIIYLCFSYRLQHDVLITLFYEQFTENNA